MARLKCLLINPPIKTNSPPYSIPLGLACIASSIDAAGHDVAIFDNNAHRVPPAEVLAQVRGEPWDLISIGGLVTTYRWQREMYRMLRREFPESLFLSGGGLASSLQDDLMGWIPEIDLLCIGEGERTVKEILEHVPAGDWDRVRGILYRDGAQVRRTPPQPLLTDGELSALPFPKIELLPLEIYFRHSGIPLSPEALSAKRRLSIETSRGCPFGCSFCIDLPTGTPRSLRHLPKKERETMARAGHAKVRYYSPEWVVGLIRHLRMKYAVDFLNFTDENFTVNRARALAICDLIEASGLTGLDPPLFFGTTAHVNTIEPGLLARMKEVGFSYLDLGLESMDDTILFEGINKNATQERNLRAFHEVMKAGIYPVTNFLVGFPQETAASVFEIARFLTENSIECGPFFVTPYPRTGLFEENREQIVGRFGSLEAFVRECETDVSADLVVNLTRYSDAELLGLRQMIMNHDLDAIRRFAKEKHEEIREPPGTTADA